MSDEICACCGNRKGCDCYSPQGALQRQLSEAQARIAALQEQAAFGLQCFQDRCENALVEQSVVTRQLAERDQRIADLTEQVRVQMEERGKGIQRIAELEGVLRRIVKRYEDEQKRVSVPCRWELPWAMYDDAKVALAPKEADHA